MKSDADVENLFAAALDGLGGRKPRAAKRPSKGFKFGDEERSIRAHVRFSEEEYALLKELCVATGFPSEGALIGSLLWDLKHRLSNGGDWGFGGLMPVLARIERQNAFMLAEASRLRSLLGAYQRSFQVFSILQESRLPKAPEPGLEPARPGPVDEVEAAKAAMREIVGAPPESGA